MRIQHNILAMNAYRNYNTNTSALAKNLEKLSSGYKINRAGDDAAGLAISEKMRAQITGLNAASKNVKDGISLVKTAEGAMQEVQDMLNRMDYLATQSANGTYDNEVDRKNLQKEVEALKTEINRIADSANFNGIKLLDGTQAGTIAQDAYTEVLKAEKIEGADRILTSDIAADEKPWQVNGDKNIYDVAAATATRSSFTVNFSKLTGNFQVTNTGSMPKGSFTAATLGQNLEVVIGSKTFTIKATSLGSAIKVVIASNGDVTASINATTLASKVVKAIASQAKTDGLGSKATFVLNGVRWKASAAGSKVQFKQVAKPTTQDECKANFDVKIKFGTNNDGTVTKESKGTFTLTGNIDAGTTAKLGVPEGARVGAATVFKMQSSDIVDGAKIRIGDSTYTLAVGPNSKVTGDKVVDLKFMKADNIDLDIALTKISQTIGSAGVTYKVSNLKGVATTATFKVTVTNNEEGHAVGLAVMRTDVMDSDDKVAFTTRSKLAGLFSIEKQAGTIKHDAVDASGGLMLQIGDTADGFNQMRVIIGDMHTKGMGVADVNISTQDGASSAISVIKDAINYVSGIRGDLGAIQNRLEHTSNNLSVMAENIQDAESTIRDTDVAEEMMAYTKNNILIQSAQAMLAQANAVPQGVLQLLG